MHTHAQQYKTKYRRKPLWVTRPRLCYTGVSQVALTLAQVTANVLEALDGSATKGADRWHTSSDGLTMAGEHTVPFLHYTPQNKLLTFGPPQVSGQIRHQKARARAQQGLRNVGVQIQI